MERKERIKNFNQFINENKFEGYTEQEKQTVVFEYFKQKYMDQSLIDYPDRTNRTPDDKIKKFQKNCEDMIYIIKLFGAFQITKNELEEQLKEIKKEIPHDDCEELFYYFMHVTKSQSEKQHQYRVLSEVLKSLIDDIPGFESKMDLPTKIYNIDRGEPNDGGFEMTSVSSREFKPQSVKDREQKERKQKEDEFRNKYPNPYGGKPCSYDELPDFDFKSICDILRYNVFEVISDIQIPDLTHFKSKFTSIFPKDSKLVKNYPTNITEDGDVDEQNFENMGEFIILGENSISVCGGGDWQLPARFSLKVNKNGEVEAFDVEKDCSFEDGDLDFKEVCELFGLNFSDYDFESKKQTEFDKFYQDLVKNKDYKIPGEAE